MFWGRTLKQGETLSLTKEAVNGSLLHLSHVSLNPASKPGATGVFINSGEKKFALVTLEKDKRDFQCVDLYFTTNTNTSFSVIGPGEVNLLGYFEPADEDKPAKAAPDSDEEESDEGVQVVGEEEGSSEEEDSEEEEPKPTAKLQPVAKPAQKLVPAKPQEDDDSEDDSEEEVVAKPPPKPAPAKAPSSQPPQPPQKKPKLAEEGQKSAQPAKQGEKPKKPAKS